jgi:hypothetical protein
MMALLARLEHPLIREVETVAAQVGDHALFGALGSLDGVRVFMEHHVWAVWDFMTLLKSLQADLAPVKLPWRPTGDAQAARLINSIVLGEESDLGPDGEPTSHFEVYLQAMRATQADHHPIERFIGLMARGLPVEAALDEAPAPAPAARFVRSTLVAAAAPLAHRVASFTIGREDIIPVMFRHLVSHLAQSRDAHDLGPLLWYLERHITLDGEDHGPMAWRLFNHVCLGDPRSRDEALAGALTALRERKLLWDGVLDAVNASAARRPHVAE